MTRLGVVDIGTLKVKLQVVEVAKSGVFKTLFSSNTLTCLGCHMEENGNRPLPEKLKATIEELKRCQQVLENYHVTKMRIVSTHALREMGQIGREVAEEIRKETGLEIKIISAQEEAELFYRAVLRDFTDNQDYTIVDVGGGSVQILIGNMRKLKHSFLLKTGTSTLWDKFTPKHNGFSHPTRSEIRKMTDYILDQLQPVPQRLKTPIIYGSSCIIELFQNLELPLTTHLNSKTHPHKTSVVAMQDFLRGVWSLSYGVRERKYKSPTKRYMWGIDKAFLNVIELAKRVEAPYVIPSNANINQGLLFSLV